MISYPTRFPEEPLLEHMAGQQRLAADAAIGLVKPVLVALSHTHAAGIVHGDLKPANIMLSNAGVVKVVDFGIARTHRRDEAMASTMHASAGRPPATPALMGTPAYMAPEQWVSHDIDARADIWAVGILLYELMLGKRPFHGDSLDVLREAICDPGQSALCGDDVDRLEELAPVIERCLRKRREERFSSADDLLGALEAVVPAAHAVSHDAPPAGCVRAVFIGVARGDSSAVRAEFRAIDKVLRARARPDSLWPVLFPTMQADKLVSSLLDHRPRVVHMSGGEGHSEEIFLGRDDGVPCPITTAGLVAIFRTHKTRLAVFHRCANESVLCLLAQDVDFIVCMDSGVAGTEVVRFARTFYQAINDGHSVQSAFEHGSLELELRQIATTQRPRLLIRGGADAEASILVPHHDAPAAFRITINGNLPPGECLALVDILRRVADDPSLICRRITKGSTILDIAATRAGTTRLEALLDDRMREFDIPGGALGSPIGGGKGMNSLEHVGQHGHGALAIGDALRDAEPLQELGDLQRVGEEVNEHVLRRRHRVMLERYLHGRGNRRVTTLSRDTELEPALLLPATSLCFWIHPITDRIALEVRGAVCSVVLAEKAYTAVLLRAAGFEVERDHSRRVHPEWTPIAELLETFHIDALELNRLFEQAVQDLEGARIGGAETLIERDTSGMAVRLCAGATVQLCVSGIEIAPVEPASQAPPMLSSIDDVAPSLLASQRVKDREYSDQERKDQRIVIDDELLGHDTMRTHEDTLPESLQLPSPWFFGASAAGHQVRQYSMREMLGRGGLGAVYLGQDMIFNRPVSMKFVPKTSSAWKTEIRSLAQCRHDNIIKTLDVLEYEDCYCIVYEYVNGRTLFEVMRTERLPINETLELVVPLVRALDYLHERRIVHRDVKPQNVIVTDSGTIRLLDFGLALLDSRVDAPEESKIPSPDAAHQRHRDLDPTFTLTVADPALSALSSAGLVMGTAVYLSPEGWMGSGVDHRADLWAVGVILYELIAGTHPFAHANREELRQFVVDLDKPLPSVRKAAPALGGLADIIDRCLRKRKEERYQSAAELLTDIETLLAREPMPSDPKGKAR